jgi:hypothetical protein
LRKATSSLGRRSLVSVWALRSTLRQAPEKVEERVDALNSYVDLVSLCDKSGDVQTIAILREDRAISASRAAIISCLSTLRTY